MRSLAIFVIVLIFLSSPWEAKANYTLSALIDSVETAQDDLRKAGFLQEIAKRLSDYDPQEAKSYANKGLNILEAYRTSYELKASLHFILAEIELKEGALREAIFNANEACHYYTIVSSQKPFFKVKSAEALMLSGTANLQAGHYQGAQLRFNQAIKSSEQFFKKHGTEFLPPYVKALVHKGEISFLLKDERDAQKKYLQAMDLLLTIDGETSQTSAFMYDKLVRFYLKQKDFTLVKNYLARQGEATRKVGENIPEIRYQINKASFQYVQGKKEAAKNSFVTIIKKTRLLNYPYLQSVACLKFGEFLLEEGDLDRAIAYYRQGLSVAQKIQANGLILEGSDALSKVYESRGDLQNALKYYHEHLRVQNEVFIEMAVSQKTAHDNILFKWKQNQDPDYGERLESQLSNEADVMQNRLQITMVSLLGLALLGVISLVYFVFYRRKHLELQDKNEVIESTMLELQRTVVELEQSKVKLKEANQVQNKLMTVIAHDLRGQFGGIQQFAEIMKTDLENLSFEFLSKFSEEFYTSTKKINALFENLIQWARSQIGEVVFKGNIHELSPILQEALFLHDERAKEKNIKLHLKVSDGLKVYTDVNMLNFILRNLITNGIKFTPSGGMLIVHAIPARHEIRLSVIDNGIGMSEEIQEKLFDIGKESSREGTEKEKGTGIGLALCAEFAAKMNTKLDVTSVPEQGTTISFGLPWVMEKDIKQENELLSIKSGS